MTDFKLRDKVRCISRPDIGGTVTKVEQGVYPHSDLEYHLIYVNCGRVYGIIAFPPHDLELDDA